ncbi:hypothetical protein [Paenibacillus caseinilyticus]|uniref:hypothetical protein n=1 Tax=Paenibacillus caseinilyticus TaxID=3098138 RepID=UPI0022B8D85B|nr:hypothetical protein [Paenibacillus caseinilyticus]MCZ8519893.1 hypothetical protein [Paenibacillus caseinilyticus]
MKNFESTFNGESYPERPAAQTLHREQLLRRSGTQSLGSLRLDEQGMSWNDSSRGRCTTSDAPPDLGEGQTSPTL